MIEPHDEAVFDDAVFAAEWGRRFRSKLDLVTYLDQYMVSTYRNMLILTFYLGTVPSKL